jgi:hypothetical protein
MEEEATEVYGQRTRSHEGVDGMGIKFMQQACYQALRGQLIQALQQMQQMYKQEAESHMRTGEGKGDLHIGEIEVLADIMTAKILSGPWGLIDAFGTGSKMDLSNPALSDYTSSEYWNPDRNDLNIRTWSKENAAGKTDMFGRPRKGSNVGGIDLEGKTVGGVTIEAQAPSHAFTAAMAWMRHIHIRRILTDAIERFPFHQYIFATKE